MFEISVLLALTSYFFLTILNRASSITRPFIFALADSRELETSLICYFRALFSALTALYFSFHLRTSFTEDDLGTSVVVTSFGIF